jgi:hypothetical protein
MPGVTPVLPVSEIIQAPPFIPAIARVVITQLRPHVLTPSRGRTQFINPAVMPRQYYVEARGLYRVFNAAEYRIYRSQTGPPQEGNTPYATTASLPYEPADVFGDGTWYVSMSYFNGAVDSGFLPLGPNGETYLRMEIDGGSEIYAPRIGPNEWRLENVGAGVVRVVGYYRQGGGLRADEWALAYSTDGSVPAADAPDVTQSITPAGMDILSYNLPAQGGGTTVTVRLQTRRDDSGTWRYSEDSLVNTIMAAAVAVGPEAAPLDGYGWVGRAPAEG